MELQVQLKEAHESHDQIVKAWQDGEYDHNFFLYERDIRTAEATIARIERKLGYKPTDLLERAEQGTSGLTLEEMIAEEQ